MLSDRPHAISIGVFLCEMHRQYPDRVSAFFENPGGFSEIEDKLAPSRVPDDVLSSPKAVAERMKARWDALAKAVGEDKPLTGIPQGGAAALDVCLTPSLVGLFQRTTTLAAAAGHRKADVMDLIKALSTDGALTRELREETGLILKERRNR